MDTKCSAEDPWREASMSSDFDFRESTTLQPIYVLDSGFHCSDLLTDFNVAPDIKGVQDTAVRTFTQWISEFVPGRNGQKIRTLGDEVMPLLEPRDGLPPMD